MRAKKGQVERPELAFSHDPDLSTACQATPPKLLRSESGTHSTLAPASRKTADRLAYIDTLRGFAACWVFLLHVHGYWLQNIRPSGVNPTRIVTFLVGTGGLGVDLFIVLSGFCLFYPLVQGPGEPVAFNLSRFYRRRAYRLLPAYYAALTVATLLALSPSIQPLLVARPINLVDISSYVFLVQTFSHGTTGSINGSLWSIALEGQLYLVFPLLIFFYKSGGMKSVIFVGLATAIAWSAAQAYLLRRGGLPFDPQLHLPARWIEFIAGMFAAKCVCRFGSQANRLAAVVFFASLPETIVLHTGLLSKMHIPSFVGNTFFGITFASLVILLSGIREPIFTSRKLFGALTGIGAISYSFYLLHQPVLLLTAPFARAMNFGVIATFALSLVTALPVTLLLAYVFFTFIERPFLERGKQTKGASTGAAVTDQALP